MRRVKTIWRVVLTTALLLALGLGLSGTADARGRAKWISAWGFSQQGLAPETVTNATVRMIARPTISGSAVRVVLQNTFGLEPVMFGAAYVGQRANGAILVPGSNRPLTFGGLASVTIPPGGQVTSDPVQLNVEAFQDLAVSLYVPGTAVPISRHTNARTTSFFTASGAGNHAAEEGNANFPSTSFTTNMWWVAAIDVLSSSAEGAIVCLGDSITDGTGNTTDGYDRWHDILVLRLHLQSKSKERWATVNEGIGGNRVTVTVPPGGSPAAVERLDRDVLGRAGVTHVIFFEGTNDLNSGLVNADQLIAGMTEVIQRVKARRLKIIGATIIPRHGASWTPQMTEYRHQVNDWIRKHADFDAVIDFDKVIRDPNNPDLMNPIYDLADHVHPNLLGYFVMGKSIDLSLFDDDDRRDRDDDD